MDEVGELVEAFLFLTFWRCAGVFMESTKPLPGKFSNLISVSSFFGMSNSFATNFLFSF